MAVNRLKLNAEKTEFMWLGSRQKLQQMTYQTLQLGGSSISASTGLRNLEVIFDPQWTNTANEYRSLFLPFSAASTGPVRRLLPIKVAKTLVSALRN